MQLGIVGYGYVGRHLYKMLTAAGHSIVVYDKYDVEHSADSRRDQINACDLVFIAVPTPALPTGACDLSMINEVVAWILPPMCIKSTVPPGTTNSLVSHTGRKIVFSPEYIGETVFHSCRGGKPPDLVVVGGAADVCSVFIKVFRDALGPEPVYFETDAVTAELAKYMENCFLATKVAFVAQFYLLSQHLGADFNRMREIWVADRRVGRSHSTVIGIPGFAGRCLPKDLTAIIAAAKESGATVSLLEAVDSFNTSVRQSCLRSASSDETHGLVGS